SFFFSSRRRHTRFSRDWSSDVCSSDLELAGRFGRVQEYLIFRADVDYSCRRKVWSNNTPVGIEESARALTERSANAINLLLCLRSEERRVGKECKYWWSGG